ncbi:MAG TPA: YCF48-related protein [Vicinamibacterales bacterium]|nr:YCF48-related protein [Vicinamibacterales bacterium]
MKRILWILMLLVAVSVAAQLSAQTGAAKPAAPAAKPAEQPKFKAIWERVAFNKDIDLNAVACSGPETCWVAGDKSTILHTADGGKTWQVQIGGDPDATDRDLMKIFVLDAQHAWAMTSSGKILGTRDGKTWAELSTVSGTSKGVWFVSPQTGFEIENPRSTTETTLNRSDDGGKTWKPIGTCGVETQVDGLPRKLGCWMQAAQFLSPTVGFMGGGATVAMGSHVAAFGRTIDGGQTWTTSIIPETKHVITGVHFWSDKAGIVVLEKGESVYWTTDAGATWTRSVKQRLWPSAHGVGEGKIIVSADEDLKQMGYSFDGGRNFTTRPFAAPARVRAVTFFDMRNGYLVGDHAMAYRYRIVPIDYSSPGMIAAMSQ